MTDIERIQPQGLAAPFSHYSSVTRVADRLYVSGLVAIGSDGQTLAVGDAAAQTTAVCRALDRICREFGVGLDRVIQTRLYISDRDDYKAVDAAYAAVFGEERPSRATIITQLVKPEYLVELVAEVLL